MGLRAHSSRAGARHAFDADHLAAIDDSTRLMVANGRSAHGVGLAFALGHSTIVLALGAFVGLAVSPLASAEVHRWQEVGTQISMLVAIGFLGVVGWFNARSLRNVSRLRREAVWRTVSQEELDGAMRSRGTVLRVVGSKRAGGALGMYAIGLLFGLGMETASEIALLALTAKASSSGEISVAGVLAFPLIFAAGMATFDTADSYVMVRMYRWSLNAPQRRLTFLWFSTLLTVALTVVMLAIYAGSLAAPLLGDTGIQLGRLSEFSTVIGAIAVAAFLATWLLAWLRARTRRPGHALVASAHQSLVHAGSVEYRTEAT